MSAPTIEPSFDLFRRPDQESSEGRAPPFEVAAPGKLS